MDYKHEWNALKQYLKNMICYYKTICQPEASRAMQRVLEQMTLSEEWYRAEVDK